MKTGILTQPLGNNYGGILQAFALQKVLKDMGHEVEILDRRGSRSVAGLVLRFLSVLKCIFRKYALCEEGIGINNPFRDDYTGIERRSDKRLRQFIRHNILTTSPLRSTEDLASIIRKQSYDAIIVGSDQVWRQKYSPCITDYFLPFMPESSETRRIAYAASFGTEDIDIDRELLPECIRGLKMFDAVSVREERGKELLQNTFSVYSEVLIDPTMLLKCDTWLKLAAKTDSDASIVTYILDADRGKEDVVKAVAEKTGLKRRSLDMESEPWIEKSLVSIPDWLGAFADAGFVVTDSFHGCVFSILFNKPFIAFANKDRGLSRLDTLLGHFGLRDRLVFSAEEYTNRWEELLKPIDYTGVNRTLDELRERSRQFLNDALAENDKTITS